MSRRKQPVPATEAEVQREAQRAALTDVMTPLDYMLSVMNDPTAEPWRRDRMAMAAAPYKHPKAGEVAGGKKEQVAEAANKAASGRFAAPLAPKLRINLS